MVGIFKHEEEVQKNGVLDGVRRSFPHKKDFEGPWSL